MADRPSASPTTSAGPIRTCVGCRMRAPQSELVRVVARDGQNAAEPAVAWLDPRRALPGRGAYLHPVPGCLDLAERRRALARALRRPGGLDTDSLRDQMTQYRSGS